MDRLTLVEQKIAELLKTIDNTVVAPVGDYQYYTRTGQVDVEDESLADALNDNDLNTVNYLVEHDGDEVPTSYTYGQNAYANRVQFKITARVKNINTSSSPRKDIRVRMNEVLGDLKYLFNENYSLGRVAELALYNGSSRVIYPSENSITTGELVFKLRVDYMQRGNHPDKLAC